LAVDDTRHVVSRGVVDLRRLHSSLLRRCLVVADVEGVVVITNHLVAITLVAIISLIFYIALTIERPTRKELEQDD
jgi:hypothetical protein